MSATHFICPSCGAEVEINPRGCPHCAKPEPPRARNPKVGAGTQRRPWEQDETHDGLDLDLPGDDTFDYDEFIADEFGAPRRRSPIEVLWWLTALILLVALVFYFVL